MMQTKQLSYIITSFAPPEIDEKFLAAKRKFNLFIAQEKTLDGNVITKNLAHITLKSSFYVHETIKDETIINALDNLVFSPVQIIANEVTIFRSARHGNVLVALVDNLPALQSIHNAIREVLEPFSIADKKIEHRQFKPHLSLLYGVPDDQVSEVTAYAKEMILPITYRLDNINLLKEVPEVRKERAFLKTYSF